MPVTHHFLCDQGVARLVWGGEVVPAQAEEEKGTGQECVSQAGQVSDTCLLARLIKTILRL